MRCPVAPPASIVSCPTIEPDYRESQIKTNRLEVPPDLTGSTIDDTLAVPELNPTGNAKFSTYASERTTAGQVKATDSTVLPASTNIRVEREGDRRWLLALQQTPEQLWPKIKEFWTSNGLVLKRADPRIGIMETGWAENRADIPAGMIRDVLSKFIDFAYSAPTRDKFRVRLERVNDGTTIYLTHYGMEEVNRGEGMGKDKSSSTQWQSRPTDPELEAEMLNRLMVYLGAAEKRAATQVAGRRHPGEAPHSVDHRRWSAGAGDRRQLCPFLALGGSGLGQHQFRGGRSGPRPG